jgi:predicted HAD superfamily Cof-like phosphohydrolase
VKREQEMVAEFHLAARQNDPLVPTIPSAAVQKLRLNLHTEEAVDELRDAFASGDIVKVADSIGDALYVVLGTAIACGINIEPIFDEIHRSNMTKFIDGTFREDGKYVKGPSYERANLAPLIASQPEATR